MVVARFIKKLADQIEADDLFERDAALVVGVSGGPDSTALLHALVDLNRHAGYALSLHVAHLNHQLRGDESDADAAFVQAAAEELHIPCTVERDDIHALAGPHGGSIEEIARHRRYDFFERVCVRHGHARRVAVGHHADDDAETILHRVVRGTGLRGLSGIPRRRAIREGSPILLVRPLLHLPRRVLLEYLAAIGAPSRSDRTNDANEPTRNRIRNVVLPLLESQVNPQVRDALLRLGQQARWVNEFLRDTVDKTFEALIIEQTDQELTLNAATLSHKSRILQAELVRRAIRALGVGERNLGFANIVAVIHLLGDSCGSRQVHLPRGVTVTRVYDRLVFSRPTDQPHEELAPEVAVHLPGVTTLPLRHLQIECHILPADRGSFDEWRHDHPPGEEWVNYDALHPPLTVRTRRPGDRFWPLGAPGTRKLSDFLIDAKVKPAVRQTVALLCDRLGPVYVIGYRIDDRVKVTSSTKQILHLRTAIL